MTESLTYSDDLLPGPNHLANLRRLLVVRLVLLGVLFPLLLLGARALGLKPAVIPLSAVILLGLAATVASFRPLGRRVALVGRNAIAAQLGIDIAVLTGVLYLAGGWTNPLISLYLVPVAVAAATLSARSTWITTAIVIGAYSLLTRFYLPLFHLHGVTDGGLSLHVSGMWLTFVIAAALVAYFGTSMAATLRERERALLAIREQNLRNEQILGIATLAAGTAHELSTPLASIAVIASELERDAAGEVKTDLGVLLEQVRACRGALSRLRDAAAPVAERLRADQLLAELCDRFDLLRPTAGLRHSFEMPADAPEVEVDNSLRQALLNLLDNAADASPREVLLVARWTPDQVEIDILDRGPGPGLERGGDRSGMGIGLWLANTSIERAGGTVRAMARAGGGSCVRVSLPAAPQAASVSVAGHAG